MKTDDQKNVKKKIKAEIYKVFFKRKIYYSEQKFDLSLNL